MENPIKQAFSNIFNDCSNVYRTVRRYLPLWKNYLDDTHEFKKWLEYNASAIENKADAGADREQVNSFIQFVNYAYEYASNDVKAIFNIIAENAGYFLNTKNEELIPDLRKQLLEFSEDPANISDYNRIILLKKNEKISDERFIEISVNKSDAELFRLVHDSDAHLHELFYTITEKRGWHDKQSAPELFSRGYLPSMVYLRLLDDDELAELYLTSNHGLSVSKREIKDILSLKQKWTGSWDYAKKLLIKNVLTFYPLDSLLAEYGDNEDALLNEVFSIKNAHFQEGCLGIVRLWTDEKRNSLFIKNIWTQILREESYGSILNYANENYPSSIKQFFVDGDYSAIIDAYFSNRKAVLSCIAQSLSNNCVLMDKVRTELNLINWDHYVSEQELLSSTKSYKEFVNNSDFITHNLCFHIPSSFDIHSIKDSRNQTFIERIRHDGKVVLGEYYSDFEGLTPEQQEAILIDEDNTLLVASAGSGKTHVLISKFNYLIKTKGIDRRRIKILTYNRKIAEETCKLLKDKFDIPFEEKQAMNFHSMAYSFCNQPVRDVKNNNKTKEEDHDSRIHDILNNIKNKAVYDDLYEHIINYGGKTRYVKGKRFYLSVYKDKNGQSGSLNSWEERRIFDFLAEHGVPFVYEEYDPDTKTKVDFTIYLPNGNKIYYEHAAISRDNTSPFEDYISIFQRKKDNHNKKRHNFFYTQSGTDYISVLNDRLIGLFPMKRDEQLIRKTKESFIKNDVYYDIVKEYLIVKDCLRENCLDINQLKQSISAKDEEDYSFLHNVYMTLDPVYNELLSQQTDLVGIVEHFNNSCLNKEITPQYDYVLIDEYQDITNLRFEMLKAIRYVSPQVKFFAVGDDWQSIYSFTESRLSLFTNFRHLWGDPSGHNAKCPTMAQTRRFNNELVWISNAFIAHDKSLSNKEVVPFSSESKTFVEIKPRDNFTEECNFIASYIKENNLSHGKNGYSILVRTNSDKKSLEEKGLIGDTIHSMKGLEADYVFVLNCNSGNIPFEYEGRENSFVNRIRGASSSSNLNEERRVFYVAMTRAKKGLFLLYKTNEEKSPFIQEIEEILSIQRDS